MITLQLHVLQKRIASHTTINLNNCFGGNPNDTIMMKFKWGYNILAPRFLKDVKNLKFVYIDSGPAIYCVGKFSWSFHGKRSAVKSLLN